MSEEDGDEGVVLQVVLGAGFEEDVGFVEEEDGFPAGDEVEDFRETVFELFGVETEIAGTDLWGVSGWCDVVGSRWRGRTRKSGRFWYSETASAVNVFPTPGGPLQ